MYDADVQLRSARQRAGADQAGFTVLEILVGLGLTIVVLATLASFNQFQLFALRNQAVQNGLQATARSVSDLFSRDVRRAGRNPTCAAGISAIADAKQHLVRVESDLDGDGAIGGPDEDVTYVFKLSTNRLERVANGTAETVVDDITVEGSWIRYFDANGVELNAGSLGLPGPDRARVRRVRIEVSLRTAAADPRNLMPLRARLANDVDIRNRYFVSPITCP